jgi:hypothetical protein
VSTLPTADPTLIRIMQYHEQRAGRARFEAYQGLTKEQRRAVVREELDATRKHERYLEATLAEMEDHDGDE